MIVCIESEKLEVQDAEIARLRAELASTRAQSNPAIPEKILAAFRGWGEGESKTNQTNYTHPGCGYVEVRAGFGGRDVFGAIRELRKLADGKSGVGQPTSITVTPTLPCVAARTLAAILHDDFSADPSKFMAGMAEARARIEETEAKLRKAK